MAYMANGGTTQELAKGLSTDYFHPQRQEEYANRIPMAKLMEMADKRDPKNKKKEEKGEDHGKKDQREWNQAQGWYQGQSNTKGNDPIA